MLRLNLHCVVWWWQFDRTFPHFFTVHMKSSQCNVYLKRTSMTAVTVNVSNTIENNTTFVLNHSNVFSRILIQKCCVGSKQTLLLFNYFKKVDKSASYVFKEVMKDLEPNAISSAAINVDLTANKKKSVSDLIANVEKETGKHIVMSPKISLFHKCVI